MSNSEQGGTIAQLLRNLCNFLPCAHIPFGFLFCKEALPQLTNGAVTGFSQGSACTKLFLARFLILSLNVFQLLCI